VGNLEEAFLKRLSWQATLAIVLIALSAALYWLHFAIFRDPHHIFIYLVGDLAFVPIEVLLVTLIIHRILASREKRARLEKLNMVIGAFFSEVGTHLLTLLSDADPALSDIRSDLVVDAGWTEAEYRRVRPLLKGREYSVDVGRIDLAALQTFLAGRRDFLLRLLENPTLLEHESFTDLLRAVFHLTEELASRRDLAALLDSDRQHLRGDIVRAYSRLVGEWLDYMRHLRENYPYLFSLAMRTNPFDETATPVVS
jgi:hypothetical protein